MPAAAPAGSTTIQLSSTHIHAWPNAIPETFKYPQRYIRFLLSPQRSMNKENDIIDKKISLVRQPWYAAHVLCYGRDTRERERGREGERERGRE
jgi:hypothetical protein